MKALFCVPVVCLVLCETSCIIDGNGSRFTEDFHYNYPLSPGARVSVENVNGSIEISGWDNDSIAIFGTKAASSEETLKEIRIDVRADKQSIAVRTVLPGPWRDGSAKYIINLPRKAQLDRIVTTNASIHVEDVNGDVRLRTTNASVHVGNLRGRVLVETSNARIQGDNLEGDCDLRTSNGSIGLDRVRGAVDARTSNASITLSLPSDIKASIDARTTHGTVSSDFEELARAHRRHTSRMEGTIGGGGSLIKLTTTNGSIRLRKF